MDSHYIPMYSLKSGQRIEILPDLFCYTNQIVNVISYGNTEISNEWTLIDMGMPKSTMKIIEVLEGRFDEGQNRRQ